jgi:hypothetical protein
MKNPSALVALLLLPLAAFAQGVTALPPMSVITFAAGQNTATMNGQMVPSGHDLYYVQAKAGQTMNVSLSSAAPLTFQVYNSETAVARAADGSPLITGKTLPDAGPSDNARAWIGAIPRDGKYLIAVGGGLATPAPYSLMVTLQ